MTSMMRNARQRPAQVSVCVPCRDTVHAAFAFDLAKLIQHSDLMGTAVIPHFCIGTLIVNQREQLARMAMDQGSSHVLWLDSDMMFPPDAIQRLLAHNVSLVAGNYVTRQYPHKTVAYRQLHDWCSYVQHTADQQQLISVAAVGMGCMLVTTALMAEMQSPLFQTTWQPHSEDHMGEDFYFCTRARELGHEIWIDPVLSLELQHLGTVGLTHHMVRSGLT